jgi:hypothetical protein
MDSDATRAGTAARGNQQAQVHMKNDSWACRV